MTPRRRPFRFVDQDGQGWVFYGADQAEAERLARAWGRKHALQLTPET